MQGVACIERPLHGREKERRRSKGEEVERERERVAGGEKSMDTGEMGPLIGLPPLAPIAR
jgi:hypothetical protein